MNEKFETPKFDIKKKLNTFFESCRWQDRFDPWEDENFRGMCKRHGFSEGDIKALSAELKKEHIDKLMDEAKQEDLDRTPAGR